MNASLQAFAEFFEIDSHLITAAAQASGPVKSTPETNFEPALAKLTRAEVDAHLLQIVRNEPGAVLSLKKRLTQLSGGKQSLLPQSTRAVGELFQLAEKIENDAKRKAREEAEHNQIQRLEKLAQNEESNWLYVEKLLNQKHGSAYDEATKLLVELSNMSEFKQRKNKFTDRFKSICGKYGKSVALMDRFRRAGLL